MDNFYKKLSQNNIILIHALLAGAAYFVVVLRFILDFTAIASSGTFLGFLFAPAIICGSAVMLIKQMRIWRDNENFKGIAVLTLCNAAVFIIAVVLGIDIALNLI